MKYKISQEASSDIENIWRYTFKNWSLEQADKYYNLIMAEIEYLAENPKSGTDYSKVRKGYFRTRVKSHFIFYRINSNNEEIEVIRILHQQMDIDTRLNE
jgi:toxin ParE1/3/4